MSELKSILKVDFVKNQLAEWDLFEAVLLETFISVYEARDFEDDLGIPFSEYNYVVSIVCMKGKVLVKYRSNWAELFTIILANILSANLNCKCIVVRNMSELLESFPWFVEVV